jgi:DNA polymerase
LTSLISLYQEISHCQRCQLAESRTNVVPGEGNEAAEIVFIGEAPGWYEDQQGRPFVGPAGRFLDELLASIGLKREDVYICNVIKCRPPNNRDPLPREIDACQLWLDQQLEILHPKLIVTLGRYSLAKFLPNESISKAHGKPHQVGNIICYPLYHPAAALHQQKFRQIIQADMLKIPSLLTEVRKLSSSPVQQLSLF